MKQTRSPIDRAIGWASRRTILKLAGGAAGLAGLGIATGQQAETTFEFRGQIGGWIGVSPSSIADARNPPLELEAGTDYRVVWTNVDGFEHNFAILDEQGDEVVRSEVTIEQGRTQTVEFTATEDMVEYLCEIHPNSMRGEVRIAGRDEPVQRPAMREDTDIIPMGGTIGLEEVASGFSSPLAFAVPPGDDTRFVVDQTGQIYALTDDGASGEPFLDISDRMVELGVANLEGYDERGLLGLAFHPNYQENRKFYVHYSAPFRGEGAGQTTPQGETSTPQDGTATPGGTPTDGDGETVTPKGAKTGQLRNDHTSVIAEFTANEDGSRADPNSERTILEIPSPQMNHNGGDIEFGPDGYLYIGIGDGGARDDIGPGHVEDWYDRNEGGNGQDVEQNLLGSILRIDVDNQDDGKNYAIPDDNPLVDGGGLPEHYAWGLRNPRSMSFNDGDLFVADAGQNLWEEVNIVENGGNYGWNVKEATHCFSTDEPANPEAITDCPTHAPDESPYDGQPLLDPIIEYRHRESTQAMIDGSVVIGGYMYQGNTITALQGAYVFGNWSGQGVLNPDGEIFVARPPSVAQGTGDGTETATGTATETETETAAGTETAAADGTEIRLGGDTAGWTVQGDSPAVGEGPNPTLTLQSGSSYRVVWENVDGVPHNFAVLDGDGNPVVESEIMSEQGATQTVTFTATDAMTEYLCQVHPNTMRGSIELGGASAQTPAESAPRNRTVTPEADETEPGTATEAATETGTPTAETGETRLWPIEELIVAGSGDGQLNRYVLAFGRDADGELYVLTTENYTPFGDTGTVYKLVPPDEGTAPTGTVTETATETATGTTTGTATETATGTETVTGTGTATETQ